MNTNHMATLAINVTSAFSTAISHLGPLSSATPYLSRLRPVKAAMRQEQIPGLMFLRFSYFVDFVGYMHCFLCGAALSTCETATPPYSKTLTSYGFRAAKPQYGKTIPQAGFFFQKNVRRYPEEKLVLR